MDGGMKKLLAVMFVALLMAGCGSTPESLCEELIEKSNELSTLLEKVKDKESAEEHRDQIESLASEHGKLFKEFGKAMEGLGEEEEKDFKKQFDEPMRTAMGGLMGASMRLKFSSYGKDISLDWTEEEK